MKTYQYTFLLFILMQFSNAYSQAVISEQNGTILINRNQSEEEIARNLKRGSYNESHLLGDSVSHELNEFEKAYVYYLPGSGAYATEQKKVIKPIIYEKIHFLDKNYTKMARKSLQSIPELRYKFIKILNIATPLVSFDTKKVDQDLSTIKDVQSIENYFLRIKFQK